jgi:hypothetical protein
MLLVDLDLCTLEFWLMVGSSLRYSFPICLGSELISNYWNYPYIWNSFKAFWLRKLYFMGFLLRSMAISTVTFFASSIVTGILFFTLIAYFYLLFFFSYSSAFFLSSLEKICLNYFYLLMSYSDISYLLGDFRVYRLYKKAFSCYRSAWWSSCISILWFFLAIYS